MQNAVNLSPVEMTEDVMRGLEERGLIIRLCPGHHEVPTEPGETVGTSVYESDVAYGSHKLLAVTVNRSTFKAFGSHSDNEEFLLIGDQETKPMYLVIALLMKDELNRKIVDRELSADDFVCLRVKYNDPNVSFFTMLADVPHGEAVAVVEGRPASFYVTEPSDLNIDLTEFGSYELCVSSE